MVGRVPSSARKVDAAAEGEDAIDGNQLVVLRRCRRRVDEPKIAAPPMPAQIGEKGAVFPVAAIDQRPVPQENADFEFRPARQQTIEKAYKRLSLQSAAFGVQHEQGIEVPARKKDQSTRSSDWRPGRQNNRHWSAPRLGSRARSASNCDPFSGSVGPSSPRATWTIAGHPTTATSPRRGSFPRTRNPNTPAMGEAAVLRAG
jgi:hypothetical protein